MAERSQDGEARRVLVLGATGTIGSAVLRELIAQGRPVTAVARAWLAHDISACTDAELLQGDVTEPGALASIMSRQKYRAVISCLASRSGAPKDAWAIDYKANHNALQAARTAGVQQFVLLSAICVQKPLLAFQHAKLAFERELRASELTWSIVRPTAFFKSLSGQVDRVRTGKPFLVFGDGDVTRCKPISDRDLARFIVGCLEDTATHGQVLPIGGPGPALGPNDQAAILSELLGREVPTRSVPISMFSVIAAILGLGARWSDWCAAKAEYARIGRYYATESMLVFDQASGAYRADLTPEFGSDTLRDHYTMLLDSELPQSCGAVTPAAH